MKTAFSILFLSYSLIGYAQKDRFTELTQFAVNDFIQHTNYNFHLIKDPLTDNIQNVKLIDLENLPDSLSSKSKTYLHNIEIYQLNADSFYVAFQYWILQTLDSDHKKKQYFTLTVGERLPENLRYPHYLIVFKANDPIIIAQTDDRELGKWKKDKLRLEKQFNYMSDKLEKGQKIKKD